MDEKKQTRVLIADDHVLLGQAVATVLRAVEGYEVIVVDSFEALQDNLANTAADIVMLDVKMPDMKGLPSIREVLELANEARVVLFSGQVDNQFVTDALALGVQGYIPKTMPLQSLESALRLIQSGVAFVPMQTGQAKADRESVRENLTDRESHIVKLAADGFTNKEIARDLDVTEVTVKMHMRSVCKKLGARNRAHAAMICRERMLI
ncbi:response regulator [Nioella nitratireducens]|uniref:response regulator n=1 Tax=Nioella nitratireducens TaxID=1287720 RepID=UPI0008FD0613|nr:response regulator transcription factor [Nioella nitratireducens]